jgi:hypothetical protein
MLAHQQYFEAERLDGCPNAAFPLFHEDKANVAFRPGQEVTTCLVANTVSLFRH